MVNVRRERWASVPQADDQIIGCQDGRTVITFQKRGGNRSGPFLEKLKKGVRVADGVESYRAWE